MERLKNPKLIGALLLVALAVVMFWQNSSEIQLNVLLLGSIKTRISTALALAFLIGTVVGALVFSRWQTKREKARNASATGTAGS